MITLAFAQMIYFIVLQAPLTGGEDGLQGISCGAILGIDGPSHLATRPGNLNYLLLFCQHFLTLENQLGQSAGSWVRVIIGVTFILCVLLFRNGFVGEFIHLINKLRRKGV